MAIIYGTSGNDAPLAGTPGDDEIYGLDGNDGLQGLEGNDLLSGDNGNDSMRGGLGNDRLLGGAGNDTMRDGPGDDIYDGGAGLDRASFFDAANGVTVNLILQAAEQATGAGSDILIGVEHVSGTPWDDLLTGDGNGNWLWGSSGGNDIIAGGAGHDLLSVGQGDHQLEGGSGVDALSLWGNLGQDVTPDGATVSLLLQGQAQNTEQGLMILTGIENLSGTPYDDLLTGDPNGNVLAGDSGDDRLNGGDGDDMLLGDGQIGIEDNIITTFDDVAVFGDPGGNDVLSGGKGDDILVGGTGNDHMSGGSGGDRFVVGAGTGADTVSDFEKKDVVAIIDVAGGDDFSDLTIVEVGKKDVLVSWGSSDSVLLGGIRAKQLDPSNFQFDDGGPTMVALSFAAATGGRGGADGVLNQDVQVL